MVMKAAVEGRTDIVVAADVSDDEWRELRQEHHSVMRRIGKWLATCPDCGHPLYPKESSSDTRFFAHRPGRAVDCAFAITDNESPEHRRMKLDIYRAASRVRGWKADLEVKAPDPDPATGRPIVVDVLASRDRAGGVVGSAPTLAGWEVQLGHMDEGLALDRHEVRDRWLERCTWVTSRRPRWADRLPWYQVAPAPRSGDVVVDGVVRWDAGSAEYVAEEPFPATAMVGYVLRGAMWIQDVGWQLDAVHRPSSARRRITRRRVQSAVAEYCSRNDRIPEYARTWTDDDWFRYAKVAHDRRRRALRQTPLELAAIARHPSIELADPPNLVSSPTYDRRRDTKPCVHCGQPVVSSIAEDVPLHHHCAWHIRRGDACAYGII